MIKLNKNENMICQPVNGAWGIRDLADDWLEGFYRITVGLPEENSMFLAAVKSIYEKEKHFYIKDKGEYIESNKKK